MTYCFFSAQYLPTSGGVERYTNNLARELVRRGEKAIVVTSALPGLPEHETDDCGIEIYRVPSFLLMGGRFPVVKPGEKARVLLRQAISKADCGIVQTRFYPLSLFAAQTAKKMRLPFVVVEHGAAHLNMGTPFLNWCGECYEHLVTHQLRRIVPAFYAVSHAGCEWLKHFKITGKGVLYNFISLEALGQETKEGIATFREERAIPVGRPLVAFTGRLVPEKGITQLAEAVLSMQGKNVAPLLAVAGDGPLLKPLQTQGSCVFALGALPQQEVFRLLRQADIFCLPSESEGMSTSVLEAAACGCYVITTDRGGSKELISSSEYGMILNDNRPETIKSALEEALENPKLRKEAAVAAQQRVLYEFSCPATCDALQAIPWKELSAAKDR